MPEEQKNVAVCQPGTEICHRSKHCLDVTFNARGADIIARCAEKCQGAENGQSWSPRIVSNPRSTGGLHTKNIANETNFIPK